MKLIYLLANALLLFNACAPARYLHPRQDATSTTSIASSTTTKSALSSSSTVSSEPAPSDSSSSTIDKSKNSASSSTTIADVAAPSNATSGPILENEAELPITPQLNPAVGVAGALLIIAGAAYLFVGIWNQTFYSFMAVSFVFALAIVVLELSTLKTGTPPSVAQQGGFVAAATVPPLIIAAIAVLVVEELPRYLVCPLSGFCFAMWMLCLKDGGLIKSKEGKTIFISLTAVVFGIPGLHHVSRRWALPILIPFAGATVVMLGVDCFTGAGLKEFWLYLWNLEDALFPLGTTTYPFTRFIKIEIGCIIVLFIFGVGAQYKHFMRIRNRENVEQEQAKATQENNNRMEDEQGRRTLMQTNLDRRVWEQIYGEGKPGDSTKHLASSNDSMDRLDSSSHGDDVQLSQLSLAQKSRPVSRRVSNQVVITVEGVDGDTIERIDPRSPSTHGTHKSKGQNQEDDQGTETSAASPSDENGDQSISPEPAITPLPFKVPKSSGKRKSAASDVSPLSTVESPIEEMQTSRTSGAWSHNGLPRLDTAGSSVQVGNALAHDDDKDSSVAATIDIMDDKGLEGESERSPVLLSGQGSPLGSHRASGDNFSGTLKPQLPGSRRSVESNGNALGELPFFESRSTTPISAKEESENFQAVPAKLSTTNLSQNLADGSSKVVLQYRTNEWVKHASVAETPEDIPEEIPGEVEEPAVQVAMGAIPSVTTKSAHRLSRPPSRGGIEVRSERPKTSSGARQSTTSLHRLSSYQGELQTDGLQRPSTAISGHPSRRSSRPSSRPTSSNLPHSPMDELSRRRSMIKHMGSSHALPDFNRDTSLLAQRSSLIQRRNSSTFSFNNYSSTNLAQGPNPASPHASAIALNTGSSQPMSPPTSPPMSPQLSAIPNENVTLAHHSPLFQQQQQPRASRISQTSFNDPGASTPSLLDKQQSYFSPSSRPVSQHEHISGWRPQGQDMHLPSRRNSQHNGGPAGPAGPLLRPASGAGGAGQKSLHSQWVQQEQAYRQRVWQQALRDEPAKNDFVSGAAGAPGKRRVSGGPLAGAVDPNIMRTTEMNVKHYEMLRKLQSGAGEGTGTATAKEEKKAREEKKA